MDHLSPERVAEIVARLMPIGGETEERRLPTLNVRAAEQAAIEPERERCAGIADAHMEACERSLASNMREDAGAPAVPAVANDDDLSPERVAEIVARLMPIGGETEERLGCISALSMRSRWMPLNADLSGSLSAR